MSSSLNACVLLAFALVLCVLLVGIKGSYSFVLTFLLVVLDKLINAKE